jgi:cytochrome b561
MSLKKLWRLASRCRLILFFAIASLTFFLFPIQHYVTISRFQHWGVAVAMLGIGFLLETACLFKKLDRWACRCYLSTGLFFASVAVVLYTNPWLDPRVKIQTTETDRMECIFIVAYLVFCIYLAAVWTKWIIEESRNKIARSGAAQTTGQNL